MYESKGKASPPLPGAMGTNNPTRSAPFKCFICLRLVKNAMLINADSLFLQQAISWFQVSGWNNVLSPNRRQETAFGLLKSVPTLQTSRPRRTEQSPVTVKNAEMIQGATQKGQDILCFTCY